ncbi:MAG: GMC family oxidoreductase [Xanthomonadales bacterium]|jgi:choline dehydrogenase-like flavoprotein|nr:GMC family oxidoreductase [Xanthomonadales bacterium]
MQKDRPLAVFDTRREVDFVIIGSGASGGVLAKQLSTAGFEVVVLEQGPYRRAKDFSHDELGVFIQGEMTSHPLWEDRQTFRHTRQEKAVVHSQGPAPALYARGVGGSSVHFTANYWRMRPLDFKERSLLGEISGTGFADWPLSYEELEPYYTRVDWEIGVSGAPGPFDAPRSKPFPVPPLPVKSSGVLLEKGAKKLGLHAQPAPMAILSKPHNNRPACLHCGFCMGFGCEANAKSSTLAAMIPLAEATGRCEIRPLSTVFKIETNQAGRVSEVAYFDAEGAPQAQKAKAVIVAANGGETPRLLLMSESSRHPDGLANGSGLVGKYLMANGHSAAYAFFDEPLNEHKSVQVTRIIHDFYENDPQRGFYGGGGIDARAFIQASPILFAQNGLPPDAPRWGKAHKDMLRRNFTRRMMLLASTTSLAQESNNITLDPEHKDGAGRPAMRITYRDHDDDLAMMKFMQDRSMELLEAAGANTTWREPVVPETVLAHLLGTCRMGADPASSVVDPYHRSHEVPNLFICDGSSLVTSGRGQPTMTIQALAFRAAEHIAGFARRGEI